MEQALMETGILLPIKSGAYQTFRILLRKVDPDPTIGYVFPTLQSGSLPRNLYNKK